MRVNHAFNQKKIFYRNCLHAHSAYEIYIRCCWSIQNICNFSYAIVYSFDFIRKLSGMIFDCCFKKLFVWRDIKFKRKTIRNLFIDFFVIKSHLVAFMDRHEFVKMERNEISYIYRIVNNHLKPQ